MVLVGIMPHEMDAAVSAIVNMKELAPRSTGAPDHHAGGARDFCLVRLADQRRQDMTRAKIEIVTGSVKIGRHCRNEVTAVLPAVGLRELDARDLGHGIPLVGRLKRPG